MRLAAIAACVALLALVAAGCGGDDDDVSSTQAWAEDFCSAVQDWTNELERIGEELGDVASLSQETIEEAGNDADAATEDFVEEIRGLGSPETESGEAIDQEIQELADTVEAEREEIRESVESAEGLGGAAQAVGQVSASFAAMGAAVQQALQAIDDEDIGNELEQAFEDAPACDELTDGS